mmetsp:Transcript_27131/g.82240  ORF Transcript_27131/g.82240 Transcript_27131/m.82240 type:complete len:203 (-) Transcript_27131:582-1190(-)
MSRRLLPCRWRCALLASSPTTICSLSACTGPTARCMLFPSSGGASIPSTTGPSTRSHATRIRTTGSTTLLTRSSVRSRHRSSFRSTSIASGSLACSASWSHSRNTLACAVQPTWRTRRSAGCRLRRCRTTTTGTTRATRVATSPSLPSAGFGIACSALGRLGARCASLRRRPRATTPRPPTPSVAPAFLAPSITRRSSFRPS